MVTEGKYLDTKLYRPVSFFLGSEEIRIIDVHLKTVVFM